MSEICQGLQFWALPLWTPKCIAHIQIQIVVLHTYFDNNGVYALHVQFSRHDPRCLELPYNHIQDFNDIHHHGKGTLPHSYDGFFQKGINRKLKE